MFSLAVYSVKIVSKGGREFEDVANFYASHDLIDFLDTKCREINKRYLTQSNNKVFELKDYKKDGRNIKGLIGSGEYGYEADVVEVNEDSMEIKKSHTKKKNQAEIIPFYFNIHVPTDGKQAFLVLQRYKQFGIKDNFVAYFKSHFDAEYNNLALDIKRVMPEKAFYKILESSTIKAYRFIKKSPSDIADALNQANLAAVKSIGEVEYIVKASKRNSLLGLASIKDWISNNKDKEPAKVEKLVEMQFDYDYIKVDLEYEGRRKTMNFQSIRNTIGNIDITDDVKKGSNGHPLFDSVDGIANDLLKDLKLLR